jgi:hypothetical protein
MHLSEGRHGAVVETSDERAAHLIEAGYAVAAPLPAKQTAETGEPTAPAPSANKTEWVSYANAIGVETEGLTRDEIIGAVEAAGPIEE